MGKFSFYKVMLNLWASDYRTHITKKRWNDYLKKISSINSQIQHKKITNIKNLKKSKDIKSIFYNNEKNF